MDSFLPIVWWVGGSVAALAVLVVLADKIRRHLAHKKLARQLLDYEERHRKANAWPGSVTVEELDSVTFSAVTFHEGFETTEVDNFLTHVREALEAHERGPRYRLPDGVLVSAEIPDISFNTTRYREGYDMGEVNEFIDRIHETLYRYEQGRGEFAFPTRGTAQNVSAESPAAPSVQPSPASAASVPNQESPRTESASEAVTPRKPRFKILPGHVDAPATRTPRTSGHASNTHASEIDDRRTGSWG
ncbi:DivIVA domain-containing protein [Neomicrococcus lactis]|uniref:DivIVA domain-containing protein n=1 Tax=Neomicrococcus lactis TaxID=732241 RepID=UPI0023016B13|nr:DivIVA domain-containing protein [Neomicrococcus lactis]